MDLPLAPSAAVPSPLPIVVRRVAQRDITGITVMGGSSWPCDTWVGAPAERWDGDCDGLWLRIAHWGSREEKNLYAAGGVCWTWESGVGGMQ